MNESIHAARQPGWNHPLLTNGGVTATATLAIVAFFLLARQCLTDVSLSETARLLGCIGFAGLILATVVVTARFIGHEGKDATDETSRKRKTQSRSESDGP